MVFTTKYSKNKPAKAPRVQKFAGGGLVDARTGKAPGDDWRELREDPNALVDEKGNWPPDRQWRELMTWGDYKKRDESRKKKD